MAGRTTTLDQIVGQRNNTAAWAQRAERWLKALMKRHGDPLELNVLPADDDNPDVLWVTMAGPIEEIQTFGMTYGASELGQAERPHVATELCFAALQSVPEFALIVPTLALDTRTSVTPIPGRVYSAYGPFVDGYAQDRLLITKPVGVLQSSLKPLNLLTLRVDFLQLVPIYPGEQTLAERIGITYFLALPEMDVLNLERPDLSVLYAHLLP